MEFLPSELQAGCEARCKSSGSKRATSSVTIDLDVSKILAINKVRACNASIKTRQLTFPPPSLHIQQAATAFAKAITLVDLGGKDSSAVTDVPTLSKTVQIGQILAWNAIKYEVLKYLDIINKGRLSYCCC